jgi:predicted nucleotidyltransferase
LAGGVDAVTIVFGSYAKGKATPRSDVDLLVVTSQDGRHWRASDLQPYVTGSIIPVDVRFTTGNELEDYVCVEHHFIHSVLRSGSTVYMRSATRRPRPAVARPCWR